MSIDNKNTYEVQPADQKTLGDVVNICRTNADALKHDNIAYLRGPATTVLIHDNSKYAALRAKGLIGDYDIWRLDWLNKEHPGYGPHTFTTYKLFLGDDGIRAKRLFELNETNGDPREEAIEGEEQTLPPYLTDDDSEFALIMQAFEGLPIRKELSGSVEQQIEGIKRFIDGDPEEAALGLHDLNQGQAEELRNLMLSAKPTRDPYFEI